jgi:hypothetical protein
MAKAKARKPVKRKDAKLTRAQKSALNRALYQEQVRAERAALNPEPAHTHAHSPDDVEAVLEALTMGDTVRNKCRELAVHPGKVLMAIAEDPQLHSRYVRARMIGAHAMVEKNLDEAEDAEKSIDTEADGANVALGIVKHKAEVRRWVSGKYNPASYGDKVTQVHEGNPNNPVQVEDTTNMTSEQLAERYQRRLAAMRAEE